MVVVASAGTVEAIARAAVYALKTLAMREVFFNRMKDEDKAIAAARAIQRLQLGSDLVHPNHQGCLPNSTPDARPLTGATMPK